LSRAMNEHGPDPTQMSDVIRRVLDLDNKEAVEFKPIPQWSNDLDKVSIATQHLIVCQQNHRLESRLCH